MCEIAVMFDEGEMALIQVHADAAGVPFNMRKPLSIGVFVRARF